MPRDVAVFLLESLWQTKLHPLENSSNSLDCSTIVGSSSFHSSRCLPPSSARAPKTRLTATHLHNRSILCLSLGRAMPEKLKNPNTTNAPIGSMPAPKTSHDSYKTAASPRPSSITASNPPKAPPKKPDDNINPSNSSTTSTA